MKEELLKLLRESGTFLSGADIGRRLGVSRAAIWKEIQALRKEGYQIDAVTNKGYCLVELEQYYNKKEIQRGLNTKVMGKELYFYETLDSTNHQLRSLALEGAPEGAVVVCETQTRGKGRNGKTWESQKNCGVWMSVLLRPNILPFEAPKITLMAGLAVCKGVREATGLSAWIKWPNDVLINGKKICGILAEMSAEMEQTHFIVMGIGVNVNQQQFQGDLAETATSLRIEAGRTFSRTKVIGCVLRNLEEVYFQYLSDFNGFVQAYKEYSCVINQQVTIVSKKSFRGKAVDIAQDGGLVVEKENGEKTVVYSGEVSLRL